MGGPPPSRRPVRPCSGGPLGLTYISRSFCPSARTAVCVWLCLEAEQSSNATLYSTYSTNLKLSAKVLDFVQFGVCAHHLPR